MRANTMLSHIAARLLIVGVLTVVGLVVEDISVWLLRFALHQKLS
jgi:hypothetical protein